MRASIGKRGLLARLAPVLGSVIAYSLASRAFPVLRGDAEPTLGILVAIATLFSPGLGAALAGIPMIAWWLSLSPGLGLVGLLLYAGLIVRGGRNWWVPAAAIAAVSLALLIQGMELISVSLMLAAAALLSPVDAALHMLFYTMLMSIPLSLTGPPGTAVNRGMLIVPCQGVLSQVEPGPPDLYSLISSEALKNAVYLLTLYVESLLSDGMVLLLQVVAFCAAGYGASKIRENLGEGRKSVILAGVLPALLLSGVYVWSMESVYGEILPPDYYLPLVIMAPSFIATASSLSRVSGQRGGIRVRRIGPLPSFKDVGGLHEIKRVLYETIILPLKNRSLMEKYGVRLPRGILLYGPPGCGKTLLMKALAREAGIKFLYVKSSDILSKWYGESERKLTELFRLARSQAPSILFFDEIDSLARSRESYSSDDVAPRLLSILLSEIDGLESSDGVIVVGSTNIPDVLDPALLRPGRFDHVIYVPPPDKEARKEIFAIHTRNIPLAEDVDLDLLASITEGYSGADIEAVCQEVARTVAKRAIARRGGVKATMKDFIEVIKRRRPSITPEMLERYEEFSRRFRSFGEPYKQEGWVIDIGEAKAALMSVIQLMLGSRDASSQPIHSVLIFGPPGCGKSSLVEEGALVAEVSVVALDIRRASGPRDVDDALLKAHKQSPSILLLEEITAKRWGVSAALAAVEAARRGRRRVLVVLTTSEPGKIPRDAILRGLFDRAIYVPPPDLEVRETVIRTELSKYPLQIGFDCSEAAKMTAGYSTRGVILVTRRAVALAMEEGLGTITLNHFAQALETLPPDLEPEHFKSIEKFIATYRGLILGFKSH